MSSNRTRRLVALGATCTAALALVTVPVTVATADETLPAWCTSTGALRADELPEKLPAYRGCDLTGRQVVDGSVSLLIQPAGQGVTIDGIGGGHGGLSLATLPDGTVVIGRDTDSSRSGVMAPPSTNNPLNPDPCATTTASAYSRAGHKAYVAVGWRYNASGVPTKVASAAYNAISGAAYGMADGRDSCGIAAIPRDSYHNYLGTTATASSVTATSCGTNDNVTVIGWGNMGSTGSLAITCTWYQTDVSPWRWVASDMKFNTAYTWTTDVLTCAGAYNVGDYDLKSIATHEWGHVFGLGHVAESGATSSQTMSTNSDGTCQDNEATLGRGDLNGMLALYGSL